MNYPIDIISLGAGVQSSTLEFMADKGLVTPRPVASAFSDTEWEPRSVYAWLDWMESQVSIPIHRVGNGDLGGKMLTLTRSKKSGKIYQNISAPFFTDTSGKKGKLNRRCTVDGKVRPLIKFSRSMIPKADFLLWKKRHKVALSLISQWNRAHKDKKPPYPHDAWMECQSDPLVIQWIGISTDEAQRMKPSKEPWIKHRWPLIEMGMTRNDCLKWMESHGLPRPPRSACVFCPYHSDKEWLRMKIEEPEEFERAAKFESDVQSVAMGDETRTGKPFLHVSLKPIHEVDFTNYNPREPSMFGNECEGMCGV